jgi:hypothetical protein
MMKKKERVSHKGLYFFLLSCLFLVFIVLHRRLFQNIFLHDVQRTIDRVFFEPPMECSEHLKEARSVFSEDAARSFDKSHLLPTA